MVLSNWSSTKKYKLWLQMFLVSQSVCLSHGYGQTHWPWSWFVAWMFFTNKPSGVYKVFWEKAAVRKDLGVSEGTPLGTRNKKPSIKSIWEPPLTVCVLFIYFLNVTVHWNFTHTFLSSSSFFQEMIFHVSIQNDGSLNIKH